MEERAGMNMQRDLILLVILAAVATPTFAQILPTVGQPGSSTKGDISIPDFSGIWAHPFYPGFELPLSGPGPVTNRSRIRQVFDNDGRPRLPGTKLLLVDHPSQQVRDYTNPILNSDAAEILKKHGEREFIGQAHP